MIEHSMVRDLLPLYCDGALSASSRKIISDHLKKCHQCRSYYNHIRRNARNFTDPETTGKYHYSEVVRRIKRRNLIEYGIGAALVATTIASVICCLLEEKK